MRMKIAQVNELGPGSMKPVQVHGKPLLLANIDGKFFVIGDICTHGQCNLTTGFLDGSAVYCPCHGGQFDVTTGAVLSAPPTEPVACYQVTVDGNDIYIDS